MKVVRIETIKEKNAFDNKEHSVFVTLPGGKTVLECVSSQDAALVKSLLTRLVIASISEVNK